MTFLSAGLLAGLVLAAVPIIIHILNRRRFQVIDWPPMKYLKMTLKKNRRRVRVEQMILLAMRTLAVILLILAVARPAFSGKGLGRFLPGRGRTSRVIVLDDSLSMGYSVGGRSAFQAGRNVAEDLIRAAGTQDHLSILLTSSLQQPVVKEGGLSDAAKFAELVARLPQSETADHWAQSFAGISRVLAAASFPSQDVTLITDLRRSGWNADVTAAANKLAAAGVSVHVIDVGSRRMENVSLRKFDAQDPIILPSQVVHLRAVIRNGSGQTISGAQALLSVDGVTRSVLLPELPSGATVEVPLNVTLEKPGRHVLSLSLPKDALPGDDSRYLALTVRPTVSVLLVDGDISAQPFESETDFLALAYSIGNSPWKVERVAEYDGRKIGVGEAAPDVMVLANVGTLTAGQVSSLERLVNNGMGLMIFTGELVDPAAYNSRLFKNGNGLLPLALDRPMDTPTAGIVVNKEAQSPLAELGKLLPAALARVRTQRYMGVRAPAILPAEVSVLARWNNAENPPAVIEKVFGKGRVMLFTTSAGKKWTDWPLDPTYVLAMRSAALGIARSQDAGGSVAAGEEIRLELEGPAFAAAMTVPNAPAGAAPASVEIQHASGAGAAATTLHFSGTQRAGIYQMSWKDETSKSQSAAFSVNPPAAESDLEPLSEMQLADLMGNLKVTVQHYDADAGAAAGLGTPVRELWRPVAMILLALLMAESVFAVFVGRDR